MIVRFTFALLLTMALFFCFKMLYVDLNQRIDHKHTLVKLRAEDCK